MKRSQEYTVITEAMDSVIASEIDRLETSKDSALEDDTITYEEGEEIQDFIDTLEGIRGKVNE